MEMLIHPIIIIMSTPSTNDMQQVICIYINWDVLPPTELSHYTIWTMQLNKHKKNINETFVVHKSLSGLYKGVTNKSSFE
jgi:hypothetical protein